MFNGGDIFRGVQRMPTVNEHVKRGKDGSEVIILFAIYLVINIFILIPILLFFFYTLAQIVPTVAVVADPDTSTYDPVPLSDLYSDAPRSRPQAPRWCFFSLGIGIRSLLSQPSSLRTRFKYLTLYRGLGIFAFISVFEGFIAALSIRFLPSLLASLPQILLPLTIVQFYALWTHTVLTHPSQKYCWQRMQPFMATLRATGPALALFLAAKALLRFALMSVYGIKALRKLGDFHPLFLGTLILVGACVEVVAVVPAHIVLTRIQVSLLPEEERTIIPVDEALGKGGKGGLGDGVGIKEAWMTIGWGAWGRLAVLYVLTFVIVVIGGGATLAVDFVFYIGVALAGWLF